MDLFGGLVVLFWDGCRNFSFQRSLGLYYIQFTRILFIPKNLEEQALKRSLSFLIIFLNLRKNLNGFPSRYYLFILALFGFTNCPCLTIAISLPFKTNYNLQRKYTTLWIKTRRAETKPMFRTVEKKENRHGND